MQIGHRRRNALVGNAVSFTPAMPANSSAARCVLVPVPVEAKLSLPGLSFGERDQFGNRMHAASDGLTTTKLALVAIKPTAAKSLFGS